MHYKVDKNEHWKLLENGINYDFGYRNQFKTIQANIIESKIVTLGDPNTNLIKYHGSAIDLAKEKWFAGRVRLYTWIPHKTHNQYYFARSVKYCYGEWVEIKWKELDDLPNRSKKYVRVCVIIDVRELNEYLGLCVPIIATGARNYAKILDTQIKPHLLKHGIKELIENDHSQ